MRMWRDVFSVATFQASRTAFEQQRRAQQITRGFNALPAKQSSGTTNARSRATGVLLSKSLVSTSESALDAVEKALTEYHAVNKRELLQLPLRRKLLALLSIAAEDCIKALGFTESELSTRVVQKDTHTNTYITGNPKNESLARNLRTLQRRSLRKAEYLELLEQHCLKHEDSHQSIHALLAQKRSTGKLIDMVRGVRMEKHDFMHRPFENKVNDEGEVEGGMQVSAIGAAFEEWMLSPANGKWPFFLYLERHSVCLGEDKAASAEVRSVSYADAKGVRNSKIGKLHAITFDGGCQMVPLGDGTAVTADTSTFTAAPGKQIVLPSTGLAAFAWTAKKELFIAEHVEGGFHHSSFTSGDHVRCAGMIRFVAGRVTEVSNNSGHYKPPQTNLRKFVEFLHKKGCLSSTADVQVCGLGGNQPPVVKVDKGSFKELKSVAIKK